MILMVQTVEVGRKKRRKTKTTARQAAYDLKHKAVLFTSIGGCFLKIYYYSSLPAPTTYYKVVDF